MSALYQGVFVERIKSTTKPYSNRRHLDKKKLWKTACFFCSLYYFSKLHVIESNVVLNEELTGASEMS